ncbi:MAG: PD40 domain-containing protein [Actinobacteria bacterium]|nr:PD40 domain-containing protein [Actinomycetota bacterium]
MIERGSAPAWSPDGRRLAYLAVGVFVANADGTASWEIAPIADSAFGLRWSPDGQRIAWREAAAIKSVATDGSSPALMTIRISPCDRLAPGSAGLAWSRDGRRSSSAGVVAPVLHWRI